MTEFVLQINEETIKAKQVCAPSTGVDICGRTFLTSGRRPISFCGRRIFLESLNDGQDEHYSEVFGDSLSEMIEERFSVKSQSYYKELVRKKLYG